MGRDETVEFDEDKVWEVANMMGFDGRSTQETPYDGQMSLQQARISLGTVSFIFV